MSKLVQRCLMIADKSGRQFFTNETNLMPILEFAKTFNMDIAIVNVAEPEILELSDLPKIVCDTKTSPAIHVEVIEQILPTDESKMVHIPLERTRAELIRTYREIRLQIQAWFVKGLTLDMKYIREQLEAHELSDSVIRTQFNRVKQEFIDNGWTITSPKKGTYKATAPEKSIKEANANFAELLEIKSPVTLTTVKPNIIPTMNEYLNVSQWAPYVIPSNSTYWNFGSGQATQISEIDITVN